MKTTDKISRYIVGLVFIFSGFVKAIDPLGSTYKFVDYFDAFGMEFLSFLALPLAIILSTLEFAIGFSLIIGTRKKLTAWLLILFMSFFTVLTFILAIYNPVSDCGCFGDAIIMTNWQTFWKNIFLMVFTVFIFINKDNFKSAWSVKKQWAILSLPIIFSILISVHCYNNLPFIDFRPYNVGTYIPEKMVSPPNAAKAEYETTLIYTKGDKIIEVPLTEIPDSTWEWVETKNVLISEGYVPPIHDFTIETMFGNDITEIVLNDDKFTFLMIAYDLNKTNLKNIPKINELANFALESGKTNFICLTSSLEPEINDFKEKTNAAYSFFNTDEITLKTIVRSNPGIILLKNGTILAKWHHRNIPSKEDILKDFIENQEYKKEATDKEEVLALFEN